MIISWKSRPMPITTAGIIIDERKLGSQEDTTREELSRDQRRKAKLSEMCKADLPVCLFWVKSNLVLLERLSWWTCRGRHTMKYIFLWWVHRGKLNTRVREISAGSQLHQMFKIFQISHYNCLFIRLVRFVWLYKFGANGSLPLVLVPCEVW